MGFVRVDPGDYAYFGGTGLTLSDVMPAYPMNADQVDIDIPTAEAVARSRAVWEWGRSPTSVAVFPVHGSKGEVSAYEVLVVFGNRDIGDLEGLRKDWEGFLSDYRSEFAARRGEVETVEELLAGMDPPAASILVAATFDSPPVMRSHLGPPRFMDNLPRGAAIAGKVLGTAEPGLLRLVDTGGEVHGFEFGHGDRTTIVLSRPGWCWIDGEQGWIRFAEDAARRDKELAAQVGGEGALAREIEAVRSLHGSYLQKWLDKTMRPMANTYISSYLVHFDCFALGDFDEEGWYYDDDIRAILSTPFNYYDNHLDYGNLVQYHSNHVGILTENICHLPDLQTVWGDYFLDWNPVEFHDVMKAVANNRGYSFIDGLSLQGGILDWHFDEGRAEIDSDRPFIWTRYGSGYYSFFAVVGYDTGPQPAEWLTHTETSNDVGLPYRISHAPPPQITTYFANPRPGGEGNYTAELTFPDGNHEVYACYTTETLKAGDRSTIRWENWDNPAWFVEIDYSGDGGRSWTEVTSHREDVEWYRWDVPCGAIGDSARVRIRQYDWQGDLQSSDGSFGNFRVEALHCPDLVVEQPMDGSPCTGTSVLFRWEPLECAAYYRHFLAVDDGDPTPNWTFRDTGINELLISGLTPGQQYQWFVGITDQCGNQHWEHIRRFTVGDGPFAPPLHVWPADGAPCISYPSVLDWDPVPGAIGYQAEIGFTCSGNVQVYDVVDTELPLLYLEVGRTYFWRVRAKDDCGNFGEFSACWSFAVEGETLPPPTLVQPTNGAMEQLIPGDLVWNALAGADAYEVQLGTACGSGTTTLIDPAATTFTYSGLNGDTTYHWRARGRSTCGSWGDWSECYFFTTRSNATWLVRPDGSGDWPTIQAAIDNSIDGDIIELDDGIFTGEGNRNVDLGVKSLIIRSLNGLPESCIVNVEGHETHPARGFLITGGQERTTILEGFSIENAYLGGTGAGAGMIVANSSPTLRHIDFVYNHAYDGGALFLANSNALVYDCEFRLNTGRNTAGAIRTSANPEGDIVECRFYGNSAVWGGGAIYNFNSSPETWLCVFSGNSSDHWGGAIHNSEAGSTPWIFRCTIDGNWAPLGGGIYNRDDAAPVIQNCLITNSLEGEAVYCTSGATVDVTCTNVFGNAGGDWVGCLADQYSNPGNRIMDPWYCLPANYEYGLHFDSPFATENNSSCYQVGALGIECGPFEPITVLVEPDGSGDYPTIQAAIDDLPTGSTILLGDGVFTGTGNRDLMTYAWQYQIRSQSGIAENCIIDCQGSPTEPHRAFYFSAAPTGTRIEYITIRGGVTTENGGAILCQWGSSPVIRGCIFEDNVTFGSGGAIAVEYDSSPEINNCQFIGNGAEGYGGAVVVRNSATVELASCWFRFNAAIAGGAVAASEQGDLTVVWSIFDRNEALWGGAMTSYAGGALTVMESTLARNIGFTGGKADKAFEAAGLRDVTPFLPDDKAQTGGGGVFCGDSSTVAIDASIIAFSQMGEAILCDSTSSAAVTCSDLFGNLGGDWLGYLEGQFGVDGNISADPLFCNTTPEDLYLAENSPCGIDSPESGCDYMGALPVECGLSPVDQPDILPTLSALHAAVPNPFNAGTKLAFDLHKPGRISLVVFDISGRRVAVLIDGESRPAGRHSEDWTGRDGAGRRVAGGVYFYRLTTEDWAATRRMVLVK